MLPKQQLSYLEEVRKLTKQKRFEIKNNILKEDTYVLFEDKLIEDSQILKKVISKYEDLDWKNNSDFENDVEMTNNDEDTLDIDIFTKLIKTVQGFSNFESHKILFLHSPLFFLKQKKRFAKY